MTEMPVCHLCGKEITEPSDRGVFGGKRALLGFTLDHVIPKSAGGTDDPENLRPAHLVCNIRRKNMPIEDWVASRRWETPPRSSLKFEPLPRPCIVCGEVIEQPRAMQLIHRGECTRNRARHLQSTRRAAK